MKKLLALFDKHLLKYLVAFTIFFVALYPKLPSVHIIRTWVYIRLEDFLIALVVAVFFVQLSRRKVRFPWPVSMPILLYWGVGLVSLIFSLIFVGPHLVGYFPHLAILEYLRRIEYMILFFVAFTTIENWDDVKHYVIAILITLFGILLYGFGQEYYLQFWALFPAFFEKYPFCFPSFQTGNEQFAKGLPLCLPTGARITSTFGGHYDLAGYLVVVMPMLAGILLAVRKLKYKIGIGVMFIASLMLIIFTASRVSFFAYLLGVVATLIFLKKKKLIVPLLILSTLFLLIFNGSTAKRIFETFRLVNVITNSQGNVVGVAETSLPTNLQNKISKNDSIIVEAPPPTENLPTGSSYITLPQAPVATSVAVVKNQIPSAEAIKLRLANGGLQLSTVSGSFLIQKALVYDISVTTRFQAEWPSAWAAFLSNPPLGKGYSTITLATDNDYLRLLGETGFLGFASFLLIFVYLGIYVANKGAKIESTLARGYVFGLAGGVIGLFLNATLIDIFEASKVAEPLWIFLGIGAGALSLVPGKVDFLGKTWRIVTNKVFLIVYLLISVAVSSGGVVNHFFVGDDFIWLKWAATATPKELPTYFVNAQGFFYRPIDKIVTYLLFAFFSLEPQGYHIFTLTLHFLMTLGVFFLALRLFGNKKGWAFLTAILFSMLPILSENLNWFATISLDMSSVFLLFGVLAYLTSREKRSVVSYIVTLVLVTVGLFTYEMSVIFPLLVLAVDFLLLQTKWNKKYLLTFLPFVVLDIAYLFIRSHTNVVAIGGDYSYNLVHLLPNAIGNMFGYVLLVIFGEQSLLWYELLRSALRVYAIPVAIVLVIGLIGATMLWGKKALALLRLESVRFVLFPVALVIIGLLPFLGFGNISERYGYFASVGFAVLLVIILQAVWKYLHKKLSFRLAAAIFGIVLAFVIGWSQYLIHREQDQWQRAGEITQEAMGLFTFEYSYGKIPQGSHIYFANVPIRYGNAWIFPVGLPDAMWFVYKNQNMQFIQVPTVADGKQAIKLHPAVAPAQDYLFVFDKNYELSRVQ